MTDNLTSKYCWGYTLIRNMGLCFDVTLPDKNRVHIIASKISGRQLNVSLTISTNDKIQFYVHVIYPLNQSHI